MSNLSRALLTGLGTGIAGWVLENALFGKRQSHYFPNLPFMPVYAAGGAAIALLEPHTRNLNLLSKAAVYGGTLTGVELLAGLLERHEGRRSWDYNGSPIDLKHSISWAILGTGVGLWLEKV